MAQQQIQKISRDTLIAEIVSKNPGKAKLLSEMLLDFGIHCIGCGASTFETLGQGVLGHGFSEQQLDKLITDLNKVIESEDTGKNTETKNITSFKLTLTPFALNKVKDSMKKMGKKNTSLRISVMAGGCSGYMYDMEFVEKPSASDLNFKQENVNIAVDKGSLELLNGIEIDYVDTLKESGFKFNNPNAEHGCGCGKSFG